MKIAATIAILLLSTVAFGASASPKYLSQEQFVQQIQYGGEQDRRNDNADNYRDRNDDRNRDRQDYGNRNNDRDFKDRPRWAAGDRVNDEFLAREYVVGDWARAGLSRPPGGHEWVRVGDEFMLVRVRDRMIAKVFFDNRSAPRER